MIEPTKVCAACGVRKPWSDFYVKEKWPDGSPRQPYARCKACHNARRAELFRADPEAKARADRRYRERVNCDPEAVARRNERRRFNYRRQRGTVERIARRAPGAPVTVDPGPFVDLVRSMGFSGQDVARLLGHKDGGGVRAVLRGDRRPTLDTVDRFCLAVGVPLSAVYPE